MTLEQIDRYCDLFENRLKKGEGLSAEQFLAECHLAPEANILVELQKVEADYRRRRRSMPLIDLGEPSPPSPQSTLVLPGISRESRIGNYKLLQKIGEGGMGVVFMAEQSYPVARRVALKVVKPGMDSKEILARFEAERQALALMDHPNIARVLDAGTTETGLPYFVMELVKGVPITTYCDEKKLTLSERLELFLPVCQAVQHAHQKGIIHRDIKPTNVLVAQYDSRPVPKIIDFGLAKAIGQRLTEKTMFTQFGQIVGTIDYMSPEQASFNQLDVDTRSDIYSLGMLLYELLTGETPFDKKRLHSAAIDEMLRIIRQEEPPRPSVRLSSHASLPSIAANRSIETKKVSLLVRGELDWIVMKSIAKERDRRYQTAGEFASDISRYLAQETVLACPPSISYQFQKFARRHRVLFTTAGLVFAALVVGLIGMSWLFVRARQAEANLAKQLIILDHRYRHLQNQSRMTTYQAHTIDRIDQVVAEFVDRLTVEISRDGRLSQPDLKPLQSELLTEGIHFWDRMIATDLEIGGRPGPRNGEMRMQLALCLARAGEHERAFREAISLSKEARSGERSVDLIRVLCLCAAAAEDERDASEGYLRTAMDLLSEAARSPQTPPIPDDDSDFANLRSQSGAEDLLEQWKDNWST